jgi:hypothetical protein
MRQQSRGAPLLPRESRRRQAQMASNFHRRLVCPCPLRLLARQPPTGAGQFSTEAQAKARCPGDTVVWVNLDSKVYHFAGTRNYGTTKSGAYMCEKDATAAGSRAAKNEKQP